MICKSCKTKINNHSQSDVLRCVDDLLKNHNALVDKYWSFGK